ncbi:MAG: hypothetical protein BHW00_07730 [Clostridium sp. 26_22]|nr:MAG: hypothetical protein BHW00_07730 [Clostridium sp. 26_22]
MKKNINGITLVALVITIIILLILAGVAITALTQTGLFENAKQAKNAMENAQNEENTILSDYDNKINEIVGGAVREESSNKGKVLWKNNDITSEFAAQTVELSDNLENYDYVKIFFQTSYSKETDVVANQFFSVESLVIDNKISTSLKTSWYESGWDGHPLMYRIVNGEKNKVYFNDGYTTGSGSNNGINNTVAIPCNIIGYKF